MFQSLRFRLPALSLAGIALAGIVTTGIAIKLYQVYTHNQAVHELRREADGLTRLYAEAARQASDQGKRAPDFAARELEAATGDKLYYWGLTVFPGQRSGLRKLRNDALTPEQQARVHNAEVFTFESTPGKYFPGDPSLNKKFVAVANPLFLGGQGYPFGALIVATPNTNLTHQWLTLLGLLSVSLLGGVAVAGGLAVYLSRRIVKPVLGLSKAADQIAEGRYDVSVPSVPGG